MESGTVQFETRLGAQAESELSVGVDLSLVESMEEYFSENEGIPDDSEVKMKVVG